MLGGKKAEILGVIQREKLLLSDAERQTLNHLRDRLFRNPEELQLPISEAEYAVLTEQERQAFHSAKRIDYILSKEIEYLLANRKLPKRLLDWFKKNKVWLFTSHVFGGLGAAATYYIEHKEEIDQLADRLLGGLLRRTDVEPSNFTPVDLSHITPAEIFTQEERFQWLVQYLVDLSDNGIELMSSEEEASWLNSQQS